MKKDFLLTKQKIAARIALNLSKLLHGTCFIVDFARN